MKTGQVPSNPRLCTDILWMSFVSRVAVPMTLLQITTKMELGIIQKNEEVANLINKYKELTRYRPKEMDNDE